MSKFLDNTYVKTIFGISIVGSAIPSIYHDFTYGHQGTWTHYGMVVVGVLYSIESILWAMDVIKRTFHVDPISKQLYVLPTSTNNTNVYVSSSKIHGNGVFAKVSFNPTDLVERCPVLPIKHTDAHYVTDYVFYIPGHPTIKALALGYGSLYNHSDTPNLRFSVENNTVVMYATKKIAKDEELFINYGR